MLKSEVCVHSETHESNKAPGLLRARDLVVVVVAAAALAPALVLELGLVVALTLVPVVVVVAVISTVYWEKRSDIRPRTRSQSCYSNLGRPGGGGKIAGKLAASPRGDQDRSRNLVHLAVVN